jgi:hypothetical protein
MNSSYRIRTILRNGKQIYPIMLRKIKDGPARGLPHRVDVIMFVGKDVLKKKGRYPTTYWIEAHPRCIEFLCSKGSSRAACRFDPFAP